MPLIIYGKPLGSTIPKPFRELWEICPKLKEASERLREIPTRELNPKGLLYVGQNEFAGTSPTDDSISYLGTDSATTCHIAVLTETGSGATCIGHFDGSLTSKGVHGMLQTILDIADPIVGRLELTLAGGFSDSRNLSVKVSEHLLSEFNKVPLDIHLMYAVITDLNTVMKGDIAFPVILGLGVDMKTREIFPATFTDRGPDYPLRNVQRTCNWRVFFPCIYDFKIRRVVINSFDYSNWDLSMVQKIIQLSDEEILQQNSTSPEQEPPNFLEDFRNMFRFVLDHPDPLVSVFPNGLPRYYKQSSDGRWVFDGHTCPS
ncbi:NTAN1 [Acanthosepion pharaonis]|uniref:NTAN1 n=1 Tax=Acanthosepion pharaonis TaxID=158019 RepID=A0A812DES9_ACAPH|nr:NTAN1 [Sepia pharaonis]